MVQGGGGYGGGGGGGRVWHWCFKSIKIGFTIAIVACSKNLDVLSPFIWAPGLFKVDL